MPRFEIDGSILKGDVSVDVIQQDIPEFLAELDALRIQRGLSYQAVADACNVSKATVYRALSGATEPTAQLIQQIAAAVQYNPPFYDITPKDFTKESYISYLQETIKRQSEENDRRVRQLHAHYNMLRNQDRRTIRLLAIALTLLIGAFILWLIIDVTHPTVGWFQRELTYQSSVTDAIEFLRDRIWNV